MNTISKIILALLILSLILAIFFPSTWEKVRGFLKDSWNTYVTPKLQVAGERIKAWLNSLNKKEVQPRLNQEIKKRKSIMEEKFKQQLEQQIEKIKKPNIPNK